ncbi:MAG: N-formylglutamate amidohydrolase [Alphaproteobacteria bacterium]|nr:N-formylglutamate amidohydrolase [Alphaproteobacteria bacterium]
MIAGDPARGVLFVCDHASAGLPPEYGSLGLAASEFTRHIAYDIGAGDVTRALAAHFGAPAVLTRFSRLLIDPNRGSDDPTLVMRLSDGSLIPGNARIDASEVEARTARYWRPYREAVARAAAAGQKAGRAPALVSIHSFTPVWRGAPRPWETGLLWDLDHRLAQGLLDELALAEPGLTIGDNEPYDGALQGDTMYELATAHGFAHVLIEFRQDLIGTLAGAGEWAARIAGPLERALAKPEIGRIEHFGSRSEGRARLARKPRLVRRTP